MNCPKFVSEKLKKESGAKELFVEINLESKKKRRIVVRVTKKEMQNKEAGIKWLK